MKPLMTLMLGIKTAVNKQDVSTVYYLHVPISCPKVKECRHERYVKI